MNIMGHLKHIASIAQESIAKKRCIALLREQYESCVDRCLPSTHLTLAIEGGTIIAPLARVRLEKKERVHGSRGVLAHWKRVNEANAEARRWLFKTCIDIYSSRRINECNEYGNTPLILSIWLRDIALVKMVLDNGAMICQPTEAKKCSFLGSFIYFFQTNIGSLSQRD